MVIDDSPEANVLRERNAFLESLAPEAKERFLDALRHAAERGASEEKAWEEAVIAAELAY